MAPITAQEKTGVEHRSLSRRIGHILGPERYVALTAIAVLCLLTIAGLLPWGVASGCAALIVCISIFASRTADQAMPEDAQPLEPALDIARTNLEGLASVLGAIPDPVAIVDGRATLRATNPAFAASFDKAEPGSSALVRFRVPEVHNAIRNAIDSRTVGRAEFSDRGRLERWFAVTVAPIGDQIGKPGFCLIHFQDLSEMRRLERMRSDFVGNASHELRTPLASLKGYLETLAGAARNDAEARDRFIGIMLEQADRMERLISDLLSLSRFETGIGRASFEPTDLADILFHVRSALRPLAAKNDVDIELDDENLVSRDIRVNGNRDELIQLFENLIENAIKYGRTGNAVRVVTERDVFDYGRKCVRIIVKDKGRGIAPEHIPRLTERFYRVDVETSREMQGTGLGLAIVKHILTRHDGYLTVRSALGEGSDFIVTMPICHDDESERKSDNI